MKNFLLFSLLIFGAVISAGAQQPTTQSTPVPQSTPNQAEETQRIIRQQREINRRFDALRNAGEINRNASSRRNAAYQNLQKLYRKPTKAELKLLAPGKEDLRKYSEFLRRSNTGLIKLIADRGCAEYTNVVNVSPDCLQLSMPGAGSSYSFRTESYRIRRLSDLTYADNALNSSGILAHAILVNIGNVPLETVSLQANGLEFLNEFETTDDFEKAKEIDRRINQGIENNGFNYSRRAVAAVNTTYVLRSIAYRGNYYRAVQGFTYDELDFDQRRDITVAFRIVRRDADSITILWKELRNQKSPSIKRHNPEQKFEENKFVAKDEINEN